MKLFIDTSNSEKTIVGLDEELFETDSRKEKSQSLLAFVVKQLKSKGKDLASINSIEVVTGPGSFTGLRVGLSVANALSLALKVPVNGRKVWEGEKVELNYD